LKIFIFLFFNGMFLRFGFQMYTNLRNEKRAGKIFGSFYGPLPENSSYFYSF